ncbi:MAG: hypothetical protein IJW55_02195 [Clostridia bacterium]|nr:hypothetical protein [Clostridia bacterium]
MEEEKQGTSAAPSADMLGALLSNPDLLRRIGSIMSAATQNTGAPSPDTSSAKTNEAGSEVSASASDTPASTPTAGGIPLDGLGAVLSDPSMLAKIPQIMAVMKPMLASMAPPKAEHEHSPSSPELCRDHLLLALKPFLSPERREAVDSIIRISKLGAVFKQLK